MQSFDEASPRRAQACRPLLLRRRDKTTAGFDLDFNLSANSSASSESGTHSFHWMAFSSQLQVPGLQVGSAQVPYNPARGDSTTGQVTYPTDWGLGNSRVFITATTESRDLNISTHGESASGFMVDVHLSANSSQSTATGTFTFDWVAVTSTGTFNP